MRPAAAAGHGLPGARRHGRGQGRADGRVPGALQACGGPGYEDGEAAGDALGCGGFCVVWAGDEGSGVVAVGVCDAGEASVRQD